MIRTTHKALLAAVCAALLLVPMSAQAERTNFKIAWSIYVGWMPWGWAGDNGILKKWADKYGITIEIIQINDYIQSINQYTAGEYDGCSMTNMDALSIPAGGGVDSTALIIGDFSNGNDGIVAKEGITLAGLAGKTINLVELSVSHYLLARALDSVSLAERDLTMVNTSDADMVAAFNTPDVEVVVTWNPLLTVVREVPGAVSLYDSGDIPGEIIDMMVVNTDVLNENPKFGKALIGAWYETMSIMSQNDDVGIAARTDMGDASGTDLAGYDHQLNTTRMFYDPAEAVEFNRSEQLIQTMNYVRNFLFDHGILGEGAPSPDYVGMSFPGDKTLGDTGNLKLRFDDSYMQMAADGKI